MNEISQRGHNKNTVVTNKCITIFSMNFEKLWPNTKTAMTCRQLREKNGEKIPSGIHYTKEFVIIIANLTRYYWREARALCSEGFATKNSAKALCSLYRSYKGASKVNKWAEDKKIFKDSPERTLVKNAFDVKSKEILASLTLKKGIVLDSEVQGSRRRELAMFW